MVTRFSRQPTGNLPEKASEGNDFFSSRWKKFLFPPTFFPGKFPVGYLEKRVTRESFLERDLATLVPKFFPGKFLLLLERRNTR